MAISSRGNDGGALLEASAEDIRIDGPDDVVEQPWPVEREVAAYKRIEPELLREHDGEWVALFRGQAVGFGGTAREAVLAAQDASEESIRTVLHRVGEPVTPRKAPPSFRISAPREAVDRE